ncbi:MAG: hypothetical protein K0U11_06830 [Gammaproteobacteria bacterium]|nr:hypothetical protein [Gammaproteobacteria bacterium]
MEGGGGCQTHAHTPLSLSLSLEASIAHALLVARPYLVNVRGGVEQAEYIDEAGEAREHTGVDHAAGRAGAGVLRLFRPCGGWCVFWGGGVGVGVGGVQKMDRTHPFFHICFPICVCSSTFP